MAKPLLFLDFETYAIGLRPDNYPPTPVGYAYKLGKEKAYVSWGHVEGVNSTNEFSARKKLWSLVAASSGIVCHNFAFDREVFVEFLGIMRNNLVWHDTMFLAFLADPYGSMSLKPLAEKHLRMPPEEQNAVRDWLEQHGVVRPGTKGWGAFICKAPVKIVGSYAIGDVDRTAKLFDHWGPLTGSAAYAREIQLTPVVTRMEQLGVRLDTKLLGKDLNNYFAILGKEDTAIRKVLGDVDVDSDRSVAFALEKKKQLKIPLPLTEKGSVSVNKKALQECVSNKKLLGSLMVRSALTTSIRTFMQPWLEMSVDGKLYFRFNQVRNDSGVGARTGRMSSSPNMMNVPSKWENIYSTLKDIGFKLGYELPNIRKYILPDYKDEVIVSVDFNQQEMRLFAHFEDGALMEAYNKNPAADAHQMVADLGGIGRKVAKTLNFAELYGAGLAVIMQWLDCTEAEAREFKRKYRAALPGVAELKKSIEHLIKGGNPITTIGGREYYPEEPKMIQGRLRDFNYKMLNYLIQGSAADQTKQAMIDYHNAPKRRGRLIFVVHDELVISVKRKYLAEETKLLCKCMSESFASDLDVPFLTEAKMGVNYGELQAI